jgi:predicted nucleotidyltransferase
LEQKLQIQLPQQAIAQFCQRWQIKEFYVFGSVLREDFRPDSDIDIMVSFEADARWGLLEFVRMRRELLYRSSVRSARSGYCLAGYSAKYP